MKEPKQEEKKIFEIINLKGLSIPYYQRPYKWQVENVTQLLNDIFEHSFTQKKVYRIGSLILHKEKEILNIVDGQQRLTTISILLHYLGEKDTLLLKQNYKHTLSKNNIVYNARVIKNWIDAKFNDKGKADFKMAVLEKCEFVLFTVYEREEAFQLFDSQNARGKPLEPYDLLKAFHLREMECNSEEDRESAVLNWEKSVEDNTLKPILGNHLFKIRKWSKNEWKYNFTKNDIDEFKGISLHRGQKYPYELSIRILDGFVDNARNDKFLQNMLLAQSYPFSITMPIINGKRFFEYIHFYIERKKELFNSNEQTAFGIFYKNYCTTYEGSWRSGDEKVRNLYENILLLFIDKFGLPVDFEGFYTAFYKSVYFIRCTNKSIRLETILNSQAKNILREINDAISPDKMKKYQFKNYKIDKKDNEMAKGIMMIKNFVNNGQ